MNLNIKDLSQYIVLLIFLLIILLVIAPGISAFFIERITGHKKKEDFDIDEMIQKKKNQFQRNEIQYSTNETKVPLQKLVHDSNANEKEELKNILTSLQWGEIEKKYSKETSNIFSEKVLVKGLSSFIHPLLEESFQENKSDPLTEWLEIYDKSALWLSLIFMNSNEQFNIQDEDSKKALALFSKNGESYNPDKYTQSNIYNELSLNELKTKEIFDKWYKNAFIFKSLGPIVPINKQNTNEWAKEILEISEVEVLEIQKELAEKKISILKSNEVNDRDLEKSQLETLSKNLEMIEKAYETLFT